METVAFASALGLLLVAVVSHYSSTKFVKRTLFHCGPVRLHTGWFSTTSVTCAMECRNRFGSKCYGMLYNMESQYCIPTGGISAHQAIPNSTEGDFYFTGSSCQSYMDFKMYYSVRYAEYTTKQDYATASSVCECMDARLMIADTDLRWSSHCALATTLNEYWLGLDDRLSEDHFVWANGQPITTLRRQIIFYYQKPNHDGDCVFRIPGTCYMDDTDCSRNLSFLCEQPQYEICL